MTVETEVLEVELKQLTQARDAARAVRDALDRDSAEWSALDEKFKAAKAAQQTLYTRLAKRQQRTREAEQAALEIPTEKDPFTLWFESRSTEDRHDFCLTHPGFLKLDWPLQLERMRTMIGAAMSRDIMAKFGLSEVEATEETESILKSDLLKIYGLFESELNAILDGSFKPVEHSSLVEWPRQTAAPIPMLAIPAPPVTNAQAAAHEENVTLRAEVRLVVNESPIARFDRERDERVAAYQARVAQLRGPQ